MNMKKENLSFYSSQASRYWYAWQRPSFDFLQASLYWAHVATLVLSLPSSFSLPMRVATPAL